MTKNEIAAILTHVAFYAAVRKLYIPDLHFIMTV